MSGWETSIFTGNPDADRSTVEQHRQAAQAQGLDFNASPMPNGGYFVRAFPRGAMSPTAMSPQYASAAGPAMGGVLVGGGGMAAAAAPMASDRVQYLRKVYGLLAMAAFVAILSGALAITAGPTTKVTIDHGHRIAVPVLVSIMLSSRIMMYGAFGVLFVATMLASAVSRVKYLNVVALLGVSVLMGVQLAPMVFVAQVMAGMGRTLSAAPVRDSFTLVGAIFVGITAYVFVTRKDFSYLGATLSMGFFVVFGACILAAVFHSQVFSLAVATVGALLSAGFLLYQTSHIFRTSRFDDPVGDALGLIVQLRNLFMFLLRILMSRR